MAYVSGAPDVHVTGRRIVATVIDGFVLGLAGGFLSQLFGFDFGVSGWSLTKLSSGGNFLLLVVAILYYVLMEGLLGRTVGKMAVGIRVIDGETGASPPGIGKAILRTIFRVVDAVFGYLVGFIVVLSSKRRRRVGDIVARTLVVRGR
ncbi:transporter [Paractinoplanes deccanensis]|uniref:Transporter n=1 Tax=Paractinoplanes deccanensis TaxID=113561 RepID=A0ABQ3YBS4_9ACTN|nr:RDD family protein [Actinoplanes deccanensis]GID77431.1 transporter [Actinoplanes deccanensis]